MFIATKVKKRKRNNILFRLLQDHILKVLVVSLWLSLCPPGKLGAHARLCKAGSLLWLHALSLFSKDAWLEQEKYAQRGLFNFSSFAPDYWFFLSIHFWLLPPFSLTTFSLSLKGWPDAHTSRTWLNCWKVFAYSLPLKAICMKVFPYSKPRESHQSN